MFKTKPKSEASPTEVALARMDCRLDQIASLYEPLAVRVANLEALARSASPEQALQHLERPGTAIGLRSQSASAARPATGWLRILRHMWPGKVGLLLSEHDELERMRSEIARTPSKPDDHRNAK